MPIQAAVTLGEADDEDRVALMLCRDASERLALIMATVSLRSMCLQGGRVELLLGGDGEDALQLRQFCWSNRAAYKSQ